ncbi:MAG TPA: DNA mismatch repair endonuclease MutL [Gemmatimonadaceae bacterium]|nr:DNA mismatch repair endonuclease MutL [Gemmatimonadaceae bacterium]
MPLPPSAEAAVSRIAVLSNAVIDQIAAGEVIERPASVVKELVENALDAGARSVEITAEDGGRTRIRVADDGTGMTREEAELAVRRHATSKIRVLDDLVGVASFGFRGEALPAIASVCELELATAFEDGAGTRLCTSGGDAVQVSEVARRRGTTVTVSRLFFNVPARHRFLRSARSEWRAISELVTSIALVRRDVRLSLEHDGRSVLVVPPAPDLRARVGAVWGAAFADRLVPVDDVAGPVHVCGLVERPADVGTGSRRVHLTVNGRAIRDAGLARAAETAYRSTIPAGLRPSIVLDIVLPADQVDVNVHPTKAEVRFRDRWNLERAIERAVRRALGTPASAATVATGAWFSAAGGTAAGAPQSLADALRQSPAAGEPLFAPGTGDDERGDAGAAPDDAPLDIPPLRQWRRTYIAFERDDGVVLIDQHSAHERVLYEKFMSALESGSAPAQRLLFPLTLHVSPAESEAFDAHREWLVRIGFEVEDFGGHTLLVHAVPMPHPRFDAERCLRETLAALAGDRLPAAAARHEYLAATLGCKAAVKAGDALSEEEMRSLVRTLAATKLPAHDVHGRATLVHIGWDEIERRFGRR